MSVISAPKFDPNLPLSEWPVYYKDGLPFIYDDEWLHYNEDGEPMGQHLYHIKLITYLVSLLEWLYRNQVCAIRQQLTFRARVKLLPEATPGQKRHRPYVELEPDVCLVKGIPQFKEATYVVGPGKPAPDIVFEIASPSTYTEDLERKFRLYGEVYKVKEYVLYDPQEERLWKGSRLRAWRLVKNQYVEIPRNEQGWVWSETLDSWLVEDEHNLWLYDAESNRRLNEAEENALRAREAEAQAKEARNQVKEERQRAREARNQVKEERQRAREARSQVKEERQRVKEAQARVEEERQRAEQLAARLEELEAQLRQLRPESKD